MVSRATSCSVTFGKVQQRVVVRRAGRADRLDPYPKVVAVQYRMWARRGSVDAIDQLRHHALRRGEVAGLPRCESWTPRQHELHPCSVVSVWTALDAFTAWPGLLTLPLRPWR